METMCVPDSWRGDGSTMINRLAQCSVNWPKLSPPNCPFQTDIPWNLAGWLYMLLYLREEKFTSFSSAISRRYCDLMYGQLLTSG